MSTPYLFVDESGNFDFSPSGTRSFILTILSTTNPDCIGIPLLALRYNLLPSYQCGIHMEEQGYFHASEDTQDVRDHVFGILTIEKEDGPAPELMLMGRRITIFINKDMPEEKRKEIIKEALTKWHHSHQFQ
jgi:hypothetical protein